MVLIQILTYCIMSHLEIAEKALIISINKEVNFKGTMCVIYG